MTNRTFVNQEIITPSGNKIIQIPVREKIDNSALLAETGVRIIHINRVATGGPSMTVAYKEINKSHIKIATSVCHKSDSFDKKIGTKLAVNNFLDGKTIIIPNPKYNVTEALKEMFGDPVTSGYCFY